MTWKFAVVETKSEHGPVFAVHEVFFDENGLINGFTEGEVAPYGETEDEFLSSFAAYARCLNEDWYVEVEPGRLKQRDGVVGHQKSKA